MASSTFWPTTSGTAMASAPALTLSLTVAALLDLGAAVGVLGEHVAGLDVVVGLLGDGDLEPEALERAAWRPPPARRSTLGTSTSVRLVVVVAEPERAGPGGRASRPSRRSSTTSTARNAPELPAGPVVVVVVDVGVDRRPATAAGGGHRGGGGEHAGGGRGRAAGGAITGSARMRLPSRKRRRSARRSSAEGYRLAGFLARHLRMIASRAAGTDGLIWRGGTGDSWTCL